ncbi:MAG: hypothetical protein A3G24_28455 [Betaproteobacteria bacterium RIFCSPLOWO2_12_FULL_62_13]|nr:MAG: hypothetical protein A3G24_28455 [Betaproteobacteria bacterium RIFCSPLOWO2_12_FULL_62_13]
MGEVGGQLLAGKPAQVVAHDDALGERLVHGHHQAPAQFGEADQQQTRAPLRVHGVAGEQPQILEDVVAQVLGLVDDEHGMNLLFPAVLPRGHRPS